MIPKNENKTEEMTSILKELHTYVPLDKTGKQIAIAFGGDQLTVERSRVCQELRAHSLEPTEQLGKLVPFAADWHAEATLLQVCIDACMHACMCSILLRTK